MYKIKIINVNETTEDTATDCIALFKLVRYRPWIAIDPGLLIPLSLVHI